MAGWPLRAKLLHSDGEAVVNTSQIITQLRTERDKLDRAIQALEQLGSSNGSGSGNRRKRRRHMSAEARAKIGEKMRQRWAERKKKKS